ncbi:MAG: hypothetical protein P8045_15915 [Candidatus Thiodiazotropha sp.]
MKNNKSATVTVISDSFLMFFPSNNTSRVKNEKRRSDVDASKVPVSLRSWKVPADRLPPRKTLPLEKIKKPSRARMEAIAICRRIIAGLCFIIKGEFRKHVFIELFSRGLGNFTPSRVNLLSFLV